MFFPHFAKIENFCKKSRPPPSLIFPSPSFEFLRSRCSPLKGTPQQRLGKNSKEGEEKIWGHKTMAKFFLTATFLGCCAAIAVLVCCCLVVILCLCVPALLCCRPVPPAAARGPLNNTHFFPLQKVECCAFFFNLM